ncbi:hypothetical protein SAV31267_095000 [Streptomyces avermitilis]|uniref:Uncharacterized protein n=1 Tax=Streptomyces avermitilis TaxID=33903 RepID=A0A4D4N990_STRAX|nr:hypothetical protein SAV31267_095000 [Streptomyces avermitilis]
MPGVGECADVDGVVAQDVEKPDDLGLGGRVITGHGGTAVRCANASICVSIHDRMSPLQRAELLRLLAEHSSDGTTLFNPEEARGTGAGDQRPPRPGPA